MVPSIEKSIDLDDIDMKGGSSGAVSTGAATAKSTQDAILDSAQISPLGATSGASGPSGSKSAGNSGSTTTSGHAGSSSGPSLSKATQGGTQKSAEIQPHGGTGSGSGNRGTTSASATTQHVTKSSKSSKPSKDDPLLQKLAVAGAVVAAGIAIVAGVRGLKKKEEEHKEPETGFEKLKRKVVGAGEEAGDKADHKAEQAKHEAEKAKKEAKERMEAQTKKNDEKARLDSIAEQKRMTYGQDGKGHPKKVLQETGDGFLNYKAWWPWAKKDL